MRSVAKTVTANLSALMKKAPAPKGKKPASPPPTPPKRKGKAK